MKQLLLNLFVKSVLDVIPAAKIANIRRTRSAADGNN